MTRAKRYRACAGYTPTPGGIAMIEATSCGGVVIFRGKILVLYKNYKNKYEGRNYEFINLYDCTLKTE